MAVARGWRPALPLDGPYPAHPRDVDALNHVFSEAFTERYRKDGMSGVRVPNLHRAIWRYAIADAGAGAMLWRGGRGEIAAFNMVHASGVEGWMGPLAVFPDYQGQGMGKEIVRAGIAWLEAQGVRTIGLETMPRTMDNIGFYSSLGFEPQALTITITLEATAPDRSPVLLGQLPPAARAAAVMECQRLLAGVLPGYDFTREIDLTREFSLGDTILLHPDERMIGFAVCHTVPLIEGRATEELRVLKLVLESEHAIAPMLRALSDYARQCGAQRIALRVQGAYPGLYRAAIAAGARVRWTDLRMTLAGHSELKGAPAVVLSNWEI